MELLRDLMLLFGNRTAQLKLPAELIAGRTLILLKLMPQALQLVTGIMFQLTITMLLTEEPSLSVLPIMTGMKEL